MRYILHILLIFLFSKLSYSQNAEYTPLNSNDVKSLPYRTFSQKSIKNYVIVPPILNKEGKTIFVSVPSSKSSLPFSIDGFSESEAIIAIKQININLIDEEFSTINVNKIDFKKQFNSKGFYYLTYYKNEDEIILFFVKDNNFVSFSIDLSTGKLSSPKIIKEKVNYTSKILFSPDSSLFSLCYLSHKRSKLNFVVYSINNSNIEEEDAFENINIAGNFSNQFQRNILIKNVFPKNSFELTPNGEIFKVTAFSGYDEENDNPDYLEIKKIDHNGIVKKVYPIENNKHIYRYIVTTDYNNVYIISLTADLNQILKTQDHHIYINDFLNNDIYRYLDVYVNEINIKKIRVSDLEEVSDKYINFDKEFVKAAWSNKIEKFFDRRVAYASRKGKNLKYGIKNLSPYFLRWSPADSSLNLVCHSFYNISKKVGPSTLSEGFAIFNIDPKSTNLNWKARISTVGMEKPGFNYFLKPNGEQYFIYRAKPENLKLDDYLTVLNKEGEMKNYQFGKQNLTRNIFYPFSSLSGNYFIYFYKESISQKNRKNQII